MYASAFVLGFHGCDESVGEKILVGTEHLHPSENNYDWLGHGIYFWENSPRRALEWAQFIQQHPQWFRTKIDRPFVLGAIIDLGRCLDLMEAQSLEVVRAAYDEMKTYFAVLGLSMPANEPGHRGDEDLLKRKLDCAVVNFVHIVRAKQQLPSFDTVRCPFVEGTALYEGARFMAKTHIQICVRQASSIRGYFRPLAATGA